MYFAYLEESVGRVIAASHVLRRLRASLLPRMLNLVELVLACRHFRL